MRLYVAPDEATQVDFCSGPVLALVDTRTGEEIMTQFFLIALYWSRHQYSEFVLNHQVETWLACHQRAFELQPLPDSSSELAIWAQVKLPSDSHG
jgi:transposase